MQTEEEFKQKLIRIFSSDFNVSDEIWSKCGKKRIDLILNHKFLDNIYFGIECKLPDKKRGDEIGKYIIQAIQYSRLEWNCNNEFKKIPIFICPALSINYFILNQEEKIINKTVYYKDRHNKDDKHHSINGFLGAFNIGEVRSKDSKNYYFSFSNQIIYRSSEAIMNGDQFYKNIHLQNYYKLINKITNGTI